jgi:hypothetical protein
MTSHYLNKYLMPRYRVVLQTEHRLSPGDGLEGLPSSPKWL